MSGKKKGELTLASVILMLLVIFIHVAAEAVTGYRRDSIHFVLLQSAHRLSSFVVQGFIFLSGLKLFLPSEKPFSYRKFYLSRLKRVVLPYIAAYIIFYIYCSCVHRITPSAGHFFELLLNGGFVGHFYFVIVICQFYLLIPLWRWVSRQNPMLAVTGALLLMIICKTAVPEVLAQFGVEFRLTARLFTSYLFYFVAGIFAGREYDAFVRFLREHRKGICVLFLICGIMSCIHIIVIERRIYYVSWAENFHIFYCIAAILALLCISLQCAPLAERKWMLLTDRASYNVYLIHPLFIYIADAWLDQWGIASLTLRLVIRFGIVYLFSIGGCVLWEALKDGLKVYLLNKENKKDGKQHGRS